MSTLVNGNAYPLFLWSINQHFYYIWKCHGQKHFIPFRTISGCMKHEASALTSYSCCWMLRLISFGIEISMAVCLLCDENWWILVVTKGKYIVLSSMHASVEKFIETEQNVQVYSHKIDKKVYNWPRPQTNFKIEKTFPFRTIDGATCVHQQNNFFQKMWQFFRHSSGSNCIRKFDSCLSFICLLIFYREPPRSDDLLRTQKQMHMHIRHIRKTTEWIGPNELTKLIGWRTSEKIAEIAIIYNETKPNQTK